MKLSIKRYLNKVVKIKLFIKKRLKNEDSFTFFAWGKCLSVIIIYHKYTTNINALNFIVYLFFYTSLSKKNYCSETKMIILSAPSGILVT